MFAEEEVPDFEFDDELELAGNPFGLEPMIYAYVEGYDDEIFWGHEFDRFGLGETIEVCAISSTQGANGKNAVLKALEDGRIVLGQYGLICIDSDYDNLEGKNQELYSSPFCFQTYAYSIENYYFQPVGILEECCKSAVSRDRTGLPCLVTLVKEWSASYFDSFCTLLLADEKQTIKQLIHKLKPYQVVGDDSGRVLTEDNKARFSESGLTADTMYLFYRGHNFQSQMLVLAKQIVKDLTEKKKDKIRLAHPEDHTKSGKFIKEYLGRQSKVDDRIRFRTPIPNNICYEKLTVDLEAYKANYHR